MDLEQYLYGRVAPLIRSWWDKGIYAVSFFVNSNETYVYRGTENVSIFAVSYHTEADCNHAGPLSEERWNDAFWQRDETYIIDAEEGNEGMEKLFAWYAENGIENVGYEGDCGTGPVGYPELVRIVSRVARRIQNEKILQKQFGGPLPILVHGLENYDLMAQATVYANPNGEAAGYLKAKYPAIQMEERGHCR
ncbi:MAG: hypothetical protein ACLSAP_10270 [Oscillospiraceae bacterium]